MQTHRIARSVLVALAAALATGCSPDAPAPPEFLGRAVLEVGDGSRLERSDIDAAISEFRSRHPHPVEFRIKYEDAVDPADARPSAVELTITRGSAGSAEADVDAAAQEFRSLLNDAQARRSAEALTRMEAEVEKQRARVEDARQRMLDAFENDAPPPPAPAHPEARSEPAGPD